MAEKEQSKFPVPAYTVSEGKQGKKRKTVFEKTMTKKSLDKQEVRRESISEWLSSGGDKVQGS